MYKYYQNGIKFFFEFITNFDNHYHLIYIPIKQKNKENIQNYACYRREV